MINLFLNEKIIAQLPGVCLTNFRVVMELSGNHTFYKHSILLKNVVACQIIQHRREKWLWKAIGWIFSGWLIYYLMQIAYAKNYDFFYPIMNKATIAYVIAILIGIAYLVFYLFYKKKGLLISDVNSEIFFAYDGVRLELIEFVDNLEVAMINYTVGTVMIKK